MTDSHLDKYIKELKNYPWSLFHLEPDDVAFIKNSYESSQKTADDYGGEFRDVKVYEMAACLINGQPDGLESQIESDLEKEPENIHAWSNKAMLHVQKGDKEKANVAMEMLREKQENQEWTKMARADYSYWIAKCKRTEEEFKHNISILSALTTDKSLSENISHNILIYYLKLVIKYCYSQKRDGAPNGSVSELREALTKLVDMRKFSSTKKSELVFWTLLTEIVTMSQFKYNNSSLAPALKEIFCESEIEVIDTRCMEEMWNLSQTNQLASNPTTEVARQCLHFSRNQTCDETKIKWLDRAISLSRKALDCTPNKFTAMWTFAKSHLERWALDYYQENPGSVNQEMAEMCRNNSEKKNKLRALTDGICLVREDLTNTERCNHLRESFRILQLISEQHGCVRLAAKHLVQISYTLHEPDSSAFEFIQKATSSAEDGDQLFNRVLSRVVFGRFYEKVGNRERAVSLYTEAVELGRNATYTRHYVTPAEHRLSQLAQG